MFDAWTLFDLVAQHAEMGAEIERSAKLTLYVVEPFHQPSRDLGHQEVVAGETGGGAISVPAYRVAIEDDHRHGFYMTPLAASAKPAPSQAGAEVEAVGCGD